MVDIVYPRAEVLEKMPTICPAVAPPIKIVKRSATALGTQVKGFSVLFDWKIIEVGANGQAMFARVVKLTPKLVMIRVIA